jgi:hypothetical protein
MTMTIITDWETEAAECGHRRWLMYHYNRSLPLFFMSVVSPTCFTTALPPECLFLHPELMQVVARVRRADMGETACP